MANERTLMAYYRGAIAMLGVSAFVFKFYSSWLFAALAIVFLVIGVGMAVYGTLRYYRFKKKILRK